MISTLSYQRKYNRFYWGILALLLVIVVVHHLNLIMFPYPLEYREGAILQTTQMLINGENPYSLSNQPESTNCYGILYHLLAYPVGKIAGVNFISHRAFTGFFILISCFMVFLFTRRRNLSPVLSMVFILLLYVSLLVNQTPQARPDSLGLVLLLLALYIPFKYEYSYKSIFISSLIGILAFYTKSYFLLVYPLLGSYLFLFVSKKKGLLYTFFSLLLLIPVVFLIDKYVLPTYIADCFFLHMNVAAYSTAYVMSQVKYLIFSYAGLAVITMLTLISLYLKKEKKIKDGLTSLNFVKYSLNKINLNKLNKPFILKNFYSVYYYAIVIFLVLYFKMAGHHGATMTYFYQLLSPFLILAALEFLAKEEESFNLFFLIGILNVAWFLYAFLPGYSSETVKRKWNKLYTVVKENENILNNPAAVSAMLEFNRKIYDNGHSEYFIFSKAPERFKSLPYFAGTDRIVSERLNSFKKEVTSLVAGRMFDIVMLPNGYDSGRDGFIPDSVLQNNYSLSSALDIPTPYNHKTWRIEIWKPKDMK